MQGCISPSHSRWYSAGASTLRRSIGESGATCITGLDPPREHRNMASERGPPAKPGRRAEWSVLRCGTAVREVNAWHTL